MVHRDASRILLIFRLGSWKPKWPMSWTPKHHQMPWLSPRGQLFLAFTTFNMRKALWTRLNQHGHVWTIKNAKDIKQKLQDVAKYIWKCIPFHQARLSIPPHIPIQGAKIMKGLCSAEKLTYLTSGVAMTPECRARIHSNCFNDRHKTKCANAIIVHIAPPLDALWCLWPLDAFSTNTSRRVLGKHRQANRCLQNGPNMLGLLGA